MPAGSRRGRIPHHNKLIFLVDLDFQPLIRSALDVRPCRVLRNHSLIATALATSKAFDPVLITYRGGENSSALAARLSGNLFKRAAADRERLRTKIEAVPVKAVKYRVPRFGFQILEKLEPGDAVAIKSDDFSVEQQSARRRIRNGISDP